MSNFKNGHRSPWIAVLPLLFLMNFSLPSALCAKPVLYQWEKVRVVHILPSRLFSQLGLTHITKHGHTLGSERHQPDPAFPAGLTDIVPYDSDHIILIRGTDSGRARFRNAVAMADAAARRWKLRIELIRGSATAGDIVATQTQDSIPTDTPVPVTFSIGQDQRSYQFHIHICPNGAVALAYQRAVPLPASTVPPQNNSVAPGVFVPALVWTVPSSQIVNADTPCLFDDPAQTTPSLPAAASNAANNVVGGYLVRLTVWEVSGQIKVGVPEDASSTEMRR